MLLWFLFFFASPKSDLLDQLMHASHEGPFLFGQENASLYGMVLDGEILSSDAWFERTARAGKWTSDTAQIAGADPAVLGIGLDMLAFEPLEWHRRELVAQAVKRQLGAGGIVTFDWHAKSCDGGGFYAEDGYQHPIGAAKDVPESLRCLCKIANDVAISNGPDAGTSARAWLQARARHIATVFREQGLGDAPFIIRPFHEQNGDWFWWGRPYWNCAALLADPHAISGADAYEKMVRTFTDTLRGEPGMENLIFAFSPAALPAKRAHLTLSERQLTDVSALAHDLLRDRLVRELSTLGLSYHGKSAGYLEGATEDIDLFGLDFYFPRFRAASARDTQQLALALRTMREAAHGKPYALTEVGTLRLPLIERIAKGQPASSVEEVTTAAALFFDPADRQRFLKALGLTIPKALAAPPPLGAAENWFTTQLLPAARDAHVAYALVWQTYNDKGAATYFIPPPGHPEAEDFARFTKSVGLTARARP